MNHAVLVDSEATSIFEPSRTKVSSLRLIDTTVVTTTLIVMLLVMLFGSSVASAAEASPDSSGGSGNGIIPLAGIETSYQKTDAIESSSISVSPGVAFQYNGISGLSVLSLSYSANTLNTASIPALSQYQVADTTDYQFEGHAYGDKYSFTALAQGTSFDDKISTKSYLDAAYVDFSKRFSPYDHLDINLGAGVLYARDGHHVIPFPVISANITYDRFQANLGFPLSYAIYTIQDGTQYLSAVVSTLGTGGITQVAYDYLPTENTDLTLGYTADNRNQAYGFLNEDIEVSRTSHSINTKLQYKYFYAQSSLYFISKLKSYDLNTNEKTQLLNYREKPFAAITIGAISYNM